MGEEEGMVVGGGERESHKDRGLGGWGGEDWEGAGLWFLSLLYLPPLLGSVPEPSWGKDAKAAP